MTAPVWCFELAARFWAAAGAAPPFPRALGPAAVWFGLAAIERPGLRVTTVCHWLAQRGIRVAFGGPDRPLRGCLYAHAGTGFAFVDATDDEAERRFTLAHELAHFLRDYWQPRETALARLGPAIREVLDGVRTATPDERLHAVLRNVPVGPFAHLMHRDDLGRPAYGCERDAEAAADRLAFELLAPAATLGEVGTRPALLDRLISIYGLPPDPAARYAAVLIPEPAACDNRLSRTFRF